MVKTLWWKGKPRDFFNAIKNAKDDGGKKFYALFSGGKDSVTVAHLLDTYGLLAGCVFVDTSIGLPETKDFVIKYCKLMGWNLKILDRMGKHLDYESFVNKFGFPGPSFHTITMRELKWKPLYTWVMNNKDEGIVLVSGVRSGESKRRMSWVKGYERDRSCKHMRWCAPIHDWSTAEVWAYVHKHGLQRSPVYSTLGISGDCLCGAFASRGEAELLNQFHPEMASYISELERNCPKKRNKWGNGSSVTGARSQKTLDWACADCVNECGSRKLIE